ncbi:MAG: hypothetical protein JSS87_04210 [Acidobacteria bacterium]|nr:hypothetical protein [Acidobacteriota bacterium]
MIATIFVDAIADGMLARVMHADVAVLLLALGGLLIAVEFNAPGTIVPGATGLFFVLLAAYALLHLPLHAWAVALLFVSFGLMAAEVKLPTAGVLGLLGVAGLVLALGNLVAAAPEHPGVSWPVAIGAGVGFGGIATALAILGERARRAKVLTGAEAMVGHIAIAQTNLEPNGVVAVRGELWQARLMEPSTLLSAGSEVKIAGFDGLVLVVTPSNVKA